MALLRLASLSARLPGGSPARGTEEGPEGPFCPQARHPSRTPSLLHALVEGAGAQKVRAGDPHPRAASAKKTRGATQGGARAGPQGGGEPQGARGAALFHTGPAVGAVS